MNSFAGGVFFGMYFPFFFLFSFGSADESGLQETTASACGDHPFFLDWACYSLCNPDLHAGPGGFLQVIASMLPWLYIPRSPLTNMRNPQSYLR
jgi:hypothetical protein